MSDINQPCPTICSACKGKCSDQLVLPAGCVLRPTIERVEAVLTPERIGEIYDAAHDEWRRDGKPFAVLLCRAISREVVAILARRPLTDEQLAKLAVEDEFLLYCDQDEFNEIARAVEHAHGIVATPAAIGIGESGGEAS